GRHDAEGGRGKDEGDAEHNLANGPRNLRLHPIPAHRHRAIARTRSSLSRHGFRVHGGPPSIGYMSTLMVTCRKTERYVSDVQTRWPVVLREATSGYPLHLNADARRSAPRARSSTVAS